MTGVTAERQDRANNVIGEYRYGVVVNRPKVRFLHKSDDAFPLLKFRKKSAFMTTPGYIEVEAVRKLLLRSFLGNRRRRDGGAVGPLGTNGSSSLKADHPLGLGTVYKLTYVLQKKEKKTFGTLPRFSFSFSMHAKYMNGSAPPPSPRT